MNKRAIMTLNGKTYEVQVKDSEIYIDGKPMEEFIQTLDIKTLLELSSVGKQALKDIITGKKLQTYQEMMDTYNKMKNN